MNKLRKLSVEKVHFRVYKTSFLAPHNMPIRELVKRDAPGNENNATFGEITGGDLKLADLRAAEHTREFDRKPAMCTLDLPAMCTLDRHTLVWLRTNCAWGAIISFFITLLHVQAQFFFNILIYSSCAKLRYKIPKGSNLGLWVVKHG